jgi:hypothetical protein
MNDKMSARWREWKASMEACKQKYGGNGHVFNMNKQPDNEFLVCEKCGMRFKRGWLYDEKEDEE